MTPQLRPGEQIIGMGLVRKPSHFNLVGIPEKYEAPVGARPTSPASALVAYMGSVRPGSRSNGSHPSQSE